MHAAVIPQLCRRSLANTAHYAPRRLIARMGLCASSLGPVPDAASIYDLPALPDIDGKPVDFAQLKGKVRAGGLRRGREGCGRRQQLAAHELASRFSLPLSLLSTQVVLVCNTASK